MVDLEWDQQALSVWLVAVEEPLLERIAVEVEDVARSIAPVRVRRTAVPRWAKQGYVGVPGRLKASVQHSLGSDPVGPYADVAALWYGRFMDPPARQLHHLIPFLPSALMMVVDGRDYYL